MSEAQPQPTLEGIDVSDPALYEHDTWREPFARLRREDPVHYQADSAFGPFWSITRFNDIVEVDSNADVFSSEPSILLGDQPEDFRFVNFIQMDPPRHGPQRREVQPAVSPRNLARMEGIIRERAGRILDGLPVGETFNWVEHVSIELTTQMLATLFDFPFEDRRKLTWWSDVAIATPELTGSGKMDEAARRQEMQECLTYFTRLWHEREGKPGDDLLSMLANGADTRGMIHEPMHFLGTLMLLIIGGNDTTRNSISGGVVALNQFPDQYDKLRADPGLIPTMVPEIIRWQTPLTHMRRTARCDVEFHGKHIRKGDKVVMWYLSGNRDDSVIDDPDALVIDRPRARHHLSFGFGIHRCMGNRLAEMQLRIVWEEIMKRFRFVEVVGEPVRVQSNFVRGFADLPVRVHPI